MGVTCASSSAPPILAWLQGMTAECGGVPSTVSAMLDGAQPTFRAINARAAARYASGAEPRIRCLLRPTSFMPTSTSCLCPAPAQIITACRLTFEICRNIVRPLLRSHSVSGCDAGPVRMIMSATSVKPVPWSATNIVLKCSIGPA